MLGQIDILTSSEIVDNTFIMDFRIAERFGEAAIKETFKRAFKGWKDDILYFTELTAVMNQLCWWHYAKGNIELSKMYSNYFYECRSYGIDNFKGDEFQYFWRVLD